MNDFTIMNYKSKIIALEKSIEAYRSSQKFVDQKEYYEKLLNKKDVAINKLKKEKHQEALYHKKAIHQWIIAHEELHQECEKQLSKKDKIIKQLEKKLHDAYLESSDAYALISELEAIIKGLKKRLEEEEGKNKKQKAQLNKNYENSSKPSSHCPNHGKIKNSRESSGKKQGGQKGHQGHGRKKYIPTNIINIAPPEEFLDTSKYVATSKMIKKQLINISLVVHVDEYQTQEFRCIANRQKVHASFPKGIHNEVNFGASVQAMAFLLNNHYNISIGKTRKFLRDASGDVFNISTGCINQMCKKFAKITKNKQDEIFDQLSKAPVLNTDFTTARVGGKQKQVLICVADDGMMFFGREHKGFKGVDNSPVEYNTNTLVHDHDKTFYHYGSKHQECLVHVLRYLKNSIENEKELSWNKRMYETIQKMMHYANGEIKDEKECQSLIEEYDLNLKIAESNYTAHPPDKYFKEGFNLAKKMRQYRDEHLLFLMDEEVPYDNNISERYARVIKRKMKQMMTFRSFESFENTCASLGVIETLRLQGGNLFDKVIDIFNMENRDSDVI